LRLARKKAQEVRERQDKRASQGQRSKQKGGVARIVMNARANLAENNSAKLKEKHIDIIDDKQQNLSELRQKQRINSDLKIDFESAQLHKGKLLIEAVNVNFGYIDEKPIWENPLNIEIRSGERIRITGNNGTGKTTLIKLITGELVPSKGEVKKTEFSYIYLDQQYSQLNKDSTVFELANEYNFNNLQEHEIKLRLNRLCFPKKHGVIIVRH